MCFASRSGICVHFSRLSWLLLGYLTYTVFGQCQHGLETACVWMHDPTSALRWKSKGSPPETWVELSGCKKPDCGMGVIESPWLAARDTGVAVRFEYKLYGTSKVFLRVNMRLEDNVVSKQLLSKAGNYAYGHTDQWAEDTLSIPPTHTSYKLEIKAYIPYEGAMVSVKGINLDGSVVITSTRSSSTTSTSTTTTTTTQSAMVRTPPRTTSTTTAKPDEEEGERTWDDFDYFPDDDDEEDERRFQALEVENFISEEDLVRGYTTVVEPRICRR